MTNALRFVSYALREVPLDGADAQAPSLLVAEEFVEGDSAKTVNLQEGRAKRVGS